MIYTKVFKLFKHNTTHSTKNKQQIDHYNIGHDYGNWTGIGKDG